VLRLHECVCVQLWKTLGDATLIIASNHFFCILGKLGTFWLKKGGVSGGWEEETLRYVFGYPCLFLWAVLLPSHLRGRVSVFPPGGDLKDFLSFFYPLRLIFLSFLGLFLSL